ncbi:orotate phosphoribosyltransferase [Thiohalorhabdus methylotrophus]|uniref:Orotate phosphoribosyltransferase n=1 Tax=Thiohalorhabdus methylotrophus TaxID=3242694 RepID=A0ABV4TYG4_9GAMM
MAPESQEAYLDLYRDSGALLEGHFLLSSGLHSNRYLQSALVLQDPEKAERLCRALAQQLPDGIEYVVGPALGGVVVAYELARALGALAQFTERKEEAMTLRRGFQLPQGARVFIMDDILTTGTSIRECYEALRDKDIDLVGCGCLVDRSDGKADVAGLPLHALVGLEVQAWEPADCPMCAEGMPVEKPGSRGA